MDIFKKNEFLYIHSLIEITFKVKEGGKEDLYYTECLQLQKKVTFDPYRGTFICLARSVCSDHENEAEFVFYQVQEKYSNG